MATSKITKQWEIQAGIIRDNAAPANSYVDQNVTFSTPFSRTPTVMATLQIASTSSTVGALSVAAINVTTTGVNIRVYNNSSTQRSANACWVAIA